MFFFFFFVFYGLFLGVGSIPIESIPGIKETGWRPAARATRGGQQLEECQDVDTLAGMLGTVLNAVSLFAIVVEGKGSRCFY